LAGKELEDVQRALTGHQNSFLTLVKANGQVLDKNNPSYMKGVKPLDYVIAAKRLNLGRKLDVTVLGVFKVYAEIKAVVSKDVIPQTIAFWHPDQAAQFEIAPGAIFDRLLPNGNLLQPTHWVFLYLHSHPEITDALVSFRSKGNSICDDLRKLIKQQSSVCTELRFTLSHQEVYNEKHKKTDYYPKFEVAGRNYTLTEDGKVAINKSGDIDAATLKEILTRSRDIQLDYTEMRMVAKRNIAALAGPPPRKALPSASKHKYAEEEEDDKEEETVLF
jgi:hypothetical protein